MEDNETAENCKDDIVYVDQQRNGPKAGLSFVVMEDDENTFNKVLQEYIEKKDYRYVASAIRDEPGRLDSRTRNLIAEALDKISKINPANRPRKNKPTAADKRSAVLQREFNMMKSEGMGKLEIYKTLRDKYGMSQETLKDNLDKSSFWGGALKDHPAYEEFLKWKAARKQNE